MFTILDCGNYYIYSSAKPILEDVCTDSQFDHSYVMFVFALTIAKIIIISGTKFVF